MGRLPTPKELDEFMGLLPLYLKLDRRSKQLIWHMIKTESERKRIRKAGN